MISPASKGTERKAAADQSECSRDRPCAQSLPAGVLQSGLGGVLDCGKVMLAQLAAMCSRRTSRFDSGHWNTQAGPLITLPSKK